MPATSLNCPECDATLRLANPVAPGKRLKCPRCEAVFTVPDADEEDVPAAIAAKPRAAAPRKNISDEDDEELPVAKARKRAQPIEDEDDEDEDEDEELDDEPADRPRRKSKNKKKKEPKKGKGLLIGLVIAGVALLFVGGGAVVVVLFFLGGGTNKGTGQEQPLAFVMADTAAVVGLDGGALMNQAALAADVEDLFHSLAPADIFTNTKDKTGVDPKDFFDKVFLAANENERPTIIIKSKVAFDQKKIAKSFTNAETKKVKGKIFYKISAGEYRTLYMPSDWILILTPRPESALEPIASADGTQIVLPAEAGTMVKQVSTSLAWVVVPIKADMANRLGNNAGPPGMENLLKPLTQSKAIGVWATLSGTQANVTGQMICADEKSAKDVANGLNGLKALLALGAGQVPPEQQGLFKELQSVQFSSEGTSAKMNLNVSIQSVSMLIKETKKQIAMSGPGGVVGPGGMPGRPGGPGGGLPGRPGAGPGNRPGGMRPPGG